MAKLNRIRKLTRYIEQENYKIARKANTIPEQNKDFPKVEKAKALKAFKRKEKLEPADVLNIYNSALDGEYVCYAKHYDNHLAGEDWQIMVTPGKGRDLIQTRFKIPTGLFRAVAKENKEIFSTGAAIVIAVCTMINLYIQFKKK